MHYSQKFSHAFILVCCLRKVSVELMKQKLGGNALVVILDEVPTAIRRSRLESTIVHHHKKEQF